MPTEERAITEEQSREAISGLSGLLENIRHGDLQNLDQLFDCLEELEPEDVGTSYEELIQFTAKEQLGLLSWTSISRNGGRSVRIGRDVVLRAAETMDRRRRFFEAKYEEHLQSEIQRALAENIKIWDLP